MAKQYGGWYDNPSTGKNQRWFNGTWTDGEEPAGGGGSPELVRSSPAPAQPAPQAQPAQGGSLWDQYSTKLAPITEQSDKLLKEYYALSEQAPTFAQKLLDSIKQAGQYPSHAAMREEYSQNPDLTPMAVESLVSRRGQAERGTIGDVMGRAQGGFESDIASRRGAAEMAQTQRGNLLEEYGFDYQAQQDTLDREKSGLGTLTERQIAEVKKSAISDVEGGLNSEDFARKYGGQLDDWELINLYNDNSPYGAMEESPAIFKKWTSGADESEDGLDPDAVDAYVSMIESGEITLANVPKEYKDEVSKRRNMGIVETEEGTNIWDRIKERL